LQLKLIELKSIEIDLVSDGQGAIFSPRPNKSNQFCSVFGCNSRSRRNPDLRSHTFPSVNEKNRLTKWINALQIGKTISRRGSLFIAFQT